MQRIHGCSEIRNFSLSVQHDLNPVNQWSIELNTCGENSISPNNHILLLVSIYRSPPLNTMNRLDHLFDPTWTRASTEVAFPSRTILHDNKWRDCKKILTTPTSTAITTCATFTSSSPTALYADFIDSYVPLPTWSTDAFKSNLKMQPIEIQVRKRQSWSNSDSNILTTYIVNEVTHFHRNEFQSMKVNAP